MKSEKGITLVSIIIYVLAMVIVVAVITVITTYFYRNVDINNEDYEINSQYTKFNSFFLDEINRKNNKIIEVGTINKNTDQEQHYIAFSSGNQYTYIKKNKSIYKNNVKIAKYINRCEFTRKIKNGKDTISVNITLDNGDIQNKGYSTTYILNN